MDSKITKMSDKAKRKHHSPWFVNKYSREVRELNTITPDNIRDDMRQFYPPATEIQSYGLTVDSPFEGFGYCKELDLNEAVIFFNPMLIYRMLRLMYGPPDIVGCLFNFSDPDKPKKMIGDWGYLLRLDNHIVAEIRSLFVNTRYVIRFWTDSELHKTPATDKGSTVMHEFGKDFNKALSKNLHLFNEQEELKKVTGKLQAFENSFAVKYKSAEYFFEMAQLLDKKPEKVKLQWDEQPKVETAGSIYMASALFYIIALESLLNIIYKIFLHDEYEGYPYGRVTTNADFEIRLSTIHLFCTCFNKRVFDQKSESWKEIDRLRQFRNDVVHGNITDEHHVHCLIEDNMMFYYSPITDFRGGTSEKKAQGSLPRFMSSVGEKEVLRIKNIVDEFVQNLLKAMDDNSKVWVESWLKELVIPPRN